MYIETELGHVKVKNVDLKLEMDVAVQNQREETNIGECHLCQPRQYGCLPNMCGGK